MPQLGLMLSSRSNTEVFGKSKLSDVRKRLREANRSVRWIFRPDRGGDSLIGDDQSLFDVWLHEVEFGEPADESTFELSLRKVREQDLRLVRYTGEAAWVSKNRDIGICHAKPLEAVAKRGKVTSLVKIEPLVPIKSDADRKFAEYLERHRMYTCVCRTEVELQHAVHECIRDPVLELSAEVQRGMR